MVFALVCSFRSATGKAKHLNLLHIHAANPKLPPQFTQKLMVLGRKMRKTFDTSSHKYRLPIHVQNFRLVSSLPIFQNVFFPLCQTRVFSPDSANAGCTARVGGKFPLAREDQKFSGLAHFLYKCTSPI